MKNQGRLRVLSSKAQNGNTLGKHRNRTSWASAADQSSTSLETFVRSFLNWMDMGVSKKVVPQIINSNRVFPYKPSIFGYPYFWKHPYGVKSISFHNLVYKMQELKRCNFKCPFLMFHFSEFAALSGPRPTPFQWSHSVCQRISSLGREQRGVNPVDLALSGYDWQILICSVAHSNQEIHPSWSIHLKEPLPSFTWHPNPCRTTQSSCHLPVKAAL